jgi:hypothetical protein
VVVFKDFIACSIGVNFFSVTGSAGFFASLIFESALSEITRLKPSWCHYCSNPSKKLHIRKSLNS